MLCVLNFIGIMILLVGHIVVWLRRETSEGRISVQIHHEFSDAFRAWAKTAEETKAALPPVNTTENVK